MAPEGFTDRRKKPAVNVGDLLHLLEIAVLLVSVGVGFEKFQQTENAVVVHTKQLDRVEHYLSSKDKDYWHIVNEER